MTRMLFRRANAQDTPAIYQLALRCGPGMTSLPKDLDTVEKRVAWSVASFTKPIQIPEDEYYFFVLEDCDTHEVVGVSAIESNTGYHTPVYSYKVSKRTRISRSLSIRSHYELLALVNDNEGRSEICTLYLKSDYRHHGNGLLLSRARFLFMKSFMERFRSTVIAEMRGVSDSAGNSPFYNAIGKHFFHMTFDDVTLLTVSTDKQFIADLVPRNPIYIDLLPPKARAVIGEPHQKTKPALNILKAEGFRYNRYVDIFDAGPTIEAPIENIQTIKKSHEYCITDVVDTLPADTPQIISNTSLDFKATIASLKTNADKKTCILEKETAQTLSVLPGDTIHVASLKR